jgi:hypothetical protein
MADETYHFHQTPAQLAIELIKELPLLATDVLYEPFKGEGAFYNNFPTANPKQWTEIVQGRDYIQHVEEYDWVITNPPYTINVDGKQVNAFWNLLDYFTNRAKKGVAFLANDKCFSTLTPLRLEILKTKGFGISYIKVCSVKKWRGRYFFIVLEKNKSSIITPVLGVF